MPNLFGVEVSAEVYELNQHLAQVKEPKSETRRDLDAERRQQFARQFEALWQLLGGPPLEKEYRFCPGREPVRNQAKPVAIVSMGAKSHGRAAGRKGHEPDRFTLSPQ